MISAIDAELMSLSRRGRRDLAWQLRHERGWTMVRIGRRLGVNRAAVSRLLRRAASEKPPGARSHSSGRRAPPRFVHGRSLSATFDI